MLSCSKSSEDNINGGVANTNENLADTLEDNNDTAVDLENTLNGGGGSSNSSSCSNKGFFQILPEKDAVVWEVVKNKKDCGYALVGGKNRKPWIKFVDENGNQLISKTYDADFKDYTSNFGNGLPTEGQLDGSARSQTKDGRYIVGT